MADISLKNLGKRIRKLRLEQGFSQEDFALKVDIDRTYIGRIERGEVNVSLLILKKIAKALNIKSKDLL